MSLRYANLQTSPRLQRALAALQAHPRGLTTMEWIREAGICAVNSCAAELRANGYRVICKPEGKSAEGASIYRYTLEGGA